MDLAILIELRRLNFQEIIKVGVPNVDSYTFEDYRKTGYEHTPLIKYCVSCENKNINSSADDKNFV